MSRTHARTRRRPWWIAAWIVLTAFVFSACGAEVQSEMTVESDGSGQRVLHAGFLKEDMEEVDGGLKALREALKKTTPDELSFDGVEKVSGDSQVEGADYVATFTLNFEDPEDYKQKVTALLKAGSRTRDATINFELNDSELANGMNIDEDFYAYELLEWTTGALVEEGVIDKEDAGSSIVSSSDSGSLSYDGESVEVRDSSMLQATAGTDNRFNSIDIAVEVLPSGGYEVRTFYRIGAANYKTGNEADTDVQREFVGSIREDVLGIDGVKDGSEMDPSQEQDTETAEPEADETDTSSEEIAVIAPGVDEVNNVLKTVTGSDEAQLELTEEPADDGKFTTTVKGTGLNCDSYCTPNTSIGNLGLRFSAIYADWERVGEPGGSFVENGEFEEVFQHGLRMSRLEGAMTIGTNSIDQELTFTADTERINNAGENIEERFDPGELGEFSVDESDGETSYQVKISGSDDEDLSDKMREYFTEAGVKDLPEVDWIRQGRTSGNFNVTSVYSGSFGATSELVSGGFEEGSRMVIELPTGWSPDEESSQSEIGEDNVAIDGSTIEVVDSSRLWSAPVKGVNMSFVFLFGGIILVVLILIVLAIIFRKKIAALFSGRDLSEDDEQLGASSEYTGSGNQPQPNPSQPAQAPPPSQAPPAPTPPPQGPPPNQPPTQPPHQPPGYGPGPQ